jgi:hypothetical protein
MRTAPELHQSLNSQQIACLHRESRVGLPLVAKGTNQILARKSDDLRREWTQVASHLQLLDMQMHSHITTTFTSRTSRALPRTLDLFTSLPTARARCRAHMAMCRHGHSVPSWRTGIHRKARHAPRRRWTRWLVSLAQVDLYPERSRRLIPLRAFQT